MSLLFLSFSLCLSGTDFNYAFLCGLKESFDLWCFHWLQIFLFHLINLSLSFLITNQAPNLLLRTIFYISLLTLFLPKPLQTSILLSILICFNPF